MNLINNSEDNPHILPMGQPPAIRLGKDPKSRIIQKVVQGWISHINTEFNQQHPHFSASESAQQCKMTIARIQALVQALATGGATGRDEAQIKELREQLFALQVPPHEKPQAEAIRYAERVLDDVAHFAQMIKDYQKLTHTLEGKLIALSEQCAKPQGALLIPLPQLSNVVTHLSKMTNYLKDNIPRASSETKVSFTQIVKEFFKPSHKENKQLVVTTLSCFEEDARRQLDGEMRTLKRCLQNKNLDVVQNALNELDSLERHLSNLSEQFETLEIPQETLHSFEELKEHYDDTIKEIQGCIIYETHSDGDGTRTVPLEITEPNLVYGSDAWRELTLRRPILEKGMLARVFSWLHEKITEHAGVLLPAMQLSSLTIKTFEEISQVSSQLKTQRDTYETILKALQGELYKGSEFIRANIENTDLTETALIGKVPAAYFLQFKEAIDKKTDIGKAVQDYVNWRIEQEMPKARYERFIKLEEAMEQGRESTTDDTESRVENAALGPIAGMGQMAKVLHDFRGDSSTDQGAIQAERAAAHMAVLKALDKTADLRHKIEVLPELQELRDTVYLLQNELSKTSWSIPPETCTINELALWEQHEGDLCYAVTSLEDRIRVLMEQARPHMAIKSHEEFGKKFDHLMKQVSLMEALPIPGVEIPAPVGISNQQMHAFITHYSPKDSSTNSPIVFERWNELSTLYANEPNHQTFFANKRVRECFAEINAALAQIFEKASTDEDAYHALVTPEIRTWLEERSVAGDRLMVRSTGAEDASAKEEGGNTATNAGGNESIAYVAPTQSEFSIALGKVVRSYFGLESLKNRIAADENPFESSLKLPVLAQTLIGEPIGGATNPNAIPSSLVLFSNEPLYIGEEKFRVMRISATFGHGEGVVKEGGIKSDTALILVSEASPDRLYIIYDNQYKPFRLAPKKNGDQVTLEMMENTGNLAHQRVLSDALIVRLYTWGIVGEKFFDDHPTDMEIVIKNGKIYPVQARDVKRQKLMPTYLDLSNVKELDSSPIVETKKGVVLIPGKASVVIANPGQIIEIETLLEALNLYNNDPEKYSAVIVRQPEPSNSHAVVNFSNMGVPCLFMERKQGIQEMLSGVTAEQQVVICMQTGKVNVWNKEVDITPFVKKGFAAHPATIVHSISVDPILRARTSPHTIPEDIFSLLEQLGDAVTTSVAAPIILKLKEKVGNIKTRVDDLEQLFANSRYPPPQARRALNDLKALKKEIDGAFDEAMANLKQPQVLGYQNFFYIKNLLTLLVDTPKQGSLGVYSALDVEKLYTHAQALIEYQNQVANPIRFGDILFTSEKAFDPAVAVQWKTFLLEAEKGATKRQEQQILELMKILDETDLTSNWFIMLFKPGSIESVLNTLPQNEVATVTKYTELAKDIREGKYSLDTLKDSSTLHTICKGIGRLVKESSVLTKSVIFQALKETVDFYDLSIKAMKMDHSMGTPAKVTEFRRMVGEFFSFLENLATEFAPIWTLSNTRMSDSFIGGFGSPQFKIGVAQNLFKSLTDTSSAQLNPSPEFSVSAAMISSDAVFERHYPLTIEDHFTWVHQGCVAIIANVENVLYTKVNTLSLPEPVKQGMMLFSSARIRAFRPQQVSFKSEGNILTIVYNIPLRNHAAKMTLKYDQYTQEVVVEGSLLGINRRGRWDNAKSYAEMLNALGIIKLNEPVYAGNQELKIIWKISALPPEEAYKTVLREFSAICLESINNDLGRFTEDYINSFIVCKREEALKVIHNEITSGIMTETGKQMTVKLWNPRRIKPEDIPLINEAANYGSVSWRNLALQIFIEAIPRSKDRKVLVPALQAALINIAHSDTNLRQKSLHLIQQSIGTLPEADTITSLIIERWRDPIEYIRIVARQVLASLWNRGKGVPEAIETVVRWEKENPGEQATTEILSLLIAKREGIEETLNIAISRATNPDRAIAMTALPLYGALVKHGQAIREAIDLIKRYSGTPFGSEQLEAIQGILSILRNPLTGFSKELLQMVDIVIKNAQEVEALPDFRNVAFRAAYDLQTSPDLNIRSKANEILETLYNKYGPTWMTQQSQARSFIRFR
ncbi:MAG: PEP/pyruvate-binding domain-containing protein [Parachlamydiaceae bacterium]